VGDRSGSKGMDGCPLTVCTILGDMELPIDKQYKLSVTIFLGCFLHLSLSQMLPTLLHIWDLHEQCLMTIHDQEPNISSYFRIINHSNNCQHYCLN
jgi:hypothetical protein